MNALTTNNPKVDFTTVKLRQRATWASGDYAIIGTTVQIVGEMLCEAVDLRSTHRVLDVAAGNGNATLAAAHRFAEVVSTDYVEALLERGRERAAAERLAVTFATADVEDLPFADGSFDVVLSTFGAMFAPDHQRTAGEMLRVCRPGGRIGLANWTPSGFIGQLFKTLGKHVPPAAGLKSPALWGSNERLHELFHPYGATVVVTPKPFVFRYRSPQHWLDVFRTYYGPVLKAFGTLDPQAQAALQRDLLMLVAQFNRAKDGTMVVPSDYLEVVVTRA